MNKLRPFLIMMFSIMNFVVTGSQTPPTTYRTTPQIDDKPVDGFENLPQSAIRPHNGSNSLFVDGTLHPRIAISSTSNHSASIADKLDCGMRLVETRDIHIGGPIGREEAHRELNFNVRKILDAIPDAKIILRVSVEPTVKFLKEHPDACVTGQNGETVFQERFNRMFTEVPKYRPSWASMAWRQDVDGELRDLIAYIAKQPYAKQIIGICLGAGHTGEFDQWFGGEGWPGGNGGDWSGESTRHFRQWLRQKYNSDVKKLREAWQDPNVTFENAEIKGLDLPVDPVTSFEDIRGKQAIYDYKTFYADQTMETIESWCKSIKEASGNRLITGAHWAVGDSGSQIMNQSPWVDFGGGPGTYFNRQPGGHRRLDFIGEDLRRNGKWFFEEMDIRTKFYGANFKGADTLEKTLNSLKRTHAQITTQGVGGYWYEFRSSCYAYPAIWRLFRKQAEISELHAKDDRTIPAQIAVVYGNEGLTKSVGDMRTNVLCRLGAPYHALRFNTLMKSDPATLPYRLYIFIGKPSLTTLERKWMKSFIERDQNWIVFLRPQGAYWPDGEKLLDLKNCSDLLGFKLSVKKGKSKDTTIVYCEQCPLPDVKQGSPIAASADDQPGMSRPSAQTIVDTRDADVKPIAVWRDGSGVAAALKRHATWTSVYSPTLRVSAPFLRAIAKAAGVHQYADDCDDVIYAGGNLLSFHNRQKGDREVKLPKIASLYDLYADKFIGHGKSSYNVPMEKFETRLFYIGDPCERLSKIREKLDSEILARRYLSQGVQRKKQEELGRPPDNGPHEPLENGKLLHWLFLGPVPVPEQKDWLAMEPSTLARTWLEGDVSNLNPEPFKQEKVVETGERIGWRSAYTGAARFYAADFYENPERRLVYYICTYLESPDGGEYNLHLRTERGHNLYLDGKKIGEAWYGKRPPVEGKPYRAPLDFKLNLKPGKRHKFVAKIFSAGGGNTGWWAKLTDKDGNPATDVKLYLNP